MWNDVETTIDYLHFSVISKTISELIIESGEDPISIRVSGSWGFGKASMVKMIGKNLIESNKDSDKYIFIEFNAWLYQGYEDAKSALLVLVYKCGQKKLNNLYYQVKEQRRCSAWRKTKNPTLRNSSSRSWICTMPKELRIHNWNVNIA